MTREEAIYRLKNTAWLGSDDDREEAEEAVVMAIKALEDIERWSTWSHTYDNLVSKQDAIDALGEEPDIWNDTEEEWAYRNAWVEHISAIKALPSADRQGVVRCKDCKYFEYNHTEVVDGVPLILAHEICAFWGGGSKTSENGYCSFGERREP